ncbi:MAG: hypothetical protein AB7U45_06555 [Desulfamplus sp.]
MTTIQTHGENLRKAVKWLSEKREADPKQNLVLLAEQAAIKFDLNPDDSEFLLRFIKEPLK